MMADKYQIENTNLSRRRFFIALGSGALMAATAGGLLVTGEFLSPNILFEPPSKFLAGKPEQYPLDSTIYLADSRVLITREKEGYFYALSAICTHLGCIVNWKQKEGIIACPCHGSKFNKIGEVIIGPAPKPLERFAIELTVEGYIQVDKSIIVDSSVILKV